MAKTITLMFFKVKKKQNRQNQIINNNNKPKNWNDINLPYYLGQIPVYINKIYTKIDIKLESKCTAEIPTKLGLPHMILSEIFFNNYIKFIKSNKKYEKFKELEILLNLFQSDKYSMWYLHKPINDIGMWFIESRFYSTDNLRSKEEMKMLEEINKYSLKKGIDFYDFLEDWVRCIFDLSAEFVIFELKMPPIFFSCENCCRPALFIKNQNINLINMNIKDNNENNNQNKQKIYGSINMVDILIRSWSNIYGFSKFSNSKKRSFNNIIYYNESYLYRKEDVLKDSEQFEDETDGTYILTTTENSILKVFEELERKKSDSIFDIIITGTSANKILSIIYNKYKKYINRICLFTFSPDKYKYLKEKYPLIEGIYYFIEDIINFIHNKNQNKPIYETVKIITYNDYYNKYNILHKMIARYYGIDNQFYFDSAISVLQDFLYWYPKLNITQNDNNINQTKIESLINSLMKFKDISSNEEEIIRLYTEENESFYKDFNEWLYKLDPLAYEKVSWFIAAMMYSLNDYMKNKNKGIKNNTIFYRGIKMSYIDLLYYFRCEGKYITFASFTSTSENKEVAELFSLRNEEKEERKNKNIYSVIIEINYQYNKEFIPNVINIEDISIDKNEKERLFLPFSFFKINKININDEDYIADIKVESIGRKDIIEKYLKEGTNLKINEEKKFIEIKSI